MDEDIKKLINKLSEALSNAFSNSEEIKEIVQNIKDKSYDLFLLLEAKIVLSKKDSDDYLKEDFLENLTKDQQKSFKSNISPEDREFLRSIKIKIEEED